MEGLLEEEEWKEVFDLMMSLMERCWRLGRGGVEDWAWERRVSQRVVLPAAGVPVMRMLGRVRGEDIVWSVVEPVREGLGKALRLLLLKKGVGQ